MDARFFERPEAPQFVRLIDLGIAVEEMNAAQLTSTGMAIGTMDYSA